MDGEVRIDLPNYNDEETGGKGVARTKGLKDGTESTYLSP